MSIKWMIKKSDFYEVRKSVNKEADSKTLEQLKKEVIAILEKNESSDVKKAIEYLESVEDKYSHLEKSVTGEWIEKAGYGVGTVRIWKGKKYKKIAQNKWVRVFDKNDRGAASSMGKYIAQVKKCNSVDELYQFCMKQRSLFQDENGVDLPIMDKLKAAIESQGKKLEYTEKREKISNEYMKEDVAKLKAGNYSFDSFDSFKAEINKQAGDRKGSNQPNYIGYLKLSNDDYLKKLYDAMPKGESKEDNPDYPFKPKTEKERAERAAFEKDRDDFIERMDKIRQEEKQKNTEKENKIGKFSNNEINSRINKGKELYEKYKTEYSQDSEDVIISDLMRYSGFNLDIETASGSSSGKTVYKPLYSASEKKEGVKANAKIEQELRDYIKNKKNEQLEDKDDSKVLSNGKTVKEVREQYGIKPKEESENVFTKEEIDNRIANGKKMIDEYFEENWNKDGIYKENARIFDIWAAGDAKNSVSPNLKSIAYKGLRGKKKEELLNTKKKIDEELENYASTVMEKYQNKESEAEKYQNHSDAMKGNQNAKKYSFDEMLKDGLKDEQLQKIHKQEIDSIVNHSMYSSTWSSVKDEERLQIAKDEIANYEENLKGIEDKLNELVQEGKSDSWIKDNAYSIKKELVLLDATKKGAEKLQEKINKNKKSELKKGLLDLISILDEEEIIEDAKKVDFEDNDASQPDLFNSTADKVSEALNSIFGC